MIIGIVASMAVINNPTSGMAFWLSIIPFTSPMTMMSRLPFGVPVWETLLSLVVLYICFMLLLWYAPKSIVLAYSCMAKNRLSWRLSVGHGINKLLKIYKINAGNVPIKALPALNPQ